ncbi:MULTISPECIES: class IV adenylate cyclase [unclassified Variovorax]|uniref:class IV adenylate cyclase n=1 Tax=unclassified Variovorax TaxID=663243 RepID=UPI003ECFD3C4
MARNVEIKARVQDLARLAAVTASFADTGPADIFQDDTFFACPSGRLKLRAFSDGTGELIFYRRPDQAGPKEVFHVRTPTSEPDGLREALNLAYGTVGRVVKHRVLYIAGRTRIHLDEVRGLGAFLELEVVLRDDEGRDDGTREAAQLMERLAIDAAQLVEVAYVDLLKQRSELRSAEQCSLSRQI